MVLQENGKGEASVSAKKLSKSGWDENQVLKNWDDENTMS